eukprot:g1969.t1
MYSFLPRVQSYTSTVLDHYPDYTGVLSVKGAVVVSDNSVTAGAIDVTFVMSGMETSATGGIHVHNGTSCATTDDPGIHFYSTGSDPWTTTYTSDATGMAKGSFTVTSGYDATANDGRVIVVHDSSGTRIACGVLGSVSTSNLATYPDYTGSVAATGYVVLGQNAGALSEVGSSMTVYYMLSNLETSTTTGGLHVHTGTSCAVAANVGGHFWDPAVEDPWTSANGAVWTTTDVSGTASGMFEVRSGYDISTNANRVIVLHESDGTRAACGALSASNLVAPTYTLEHTATVLGAYPEYAGTLSVKGAVVVSGDSAMIDVDFVMSGLEMSATGGIHVHSGTSCATTSDPEGHFYSTGSDPWTTTYTSDATGTAMGSFTVTSGYNVAENDGRVIVVHDSSGTRIACGVLGSVPSTDLGDYPGYSGSRREGYVVLGQDAGAENELNSELTVYYMLTELEETATTGGLHVHSGFSCATADGVGGHFWDSAVADPWTSANGAVWTTTDISGTAGGMFQVRSGYDISTNADHVFVLHNSDGTRAACGVLSASNLKTLPQVYTSTVLDHYPDYTGALSVNGAVVVSDNSVTAGAIDVTFVMSGMETSATGGIHVHNGTSCATTDDPGIHFYSTGSDPWTTTYTSDATGMAKGSFTVTSGYDATANDGRVIVVHDSSGTRIACGVLGSVSTSNLATYPDYTGSVAATGYVVLGQNAGALSEVGSSMTVYYMLSNLETSTTTGGLHVHTGTSCAVAANVGGHFWDPAVEDPWTSANGAVWTTTDVSGTASGMFEVRSGYDISTNANRVIVLHESDGTRAACGALSASNLVAPTYTLEHTATVLGAYPEYAGTLSVKGAVVVSGDSAMIDVDFVMSGLEMSATGGIHVHSGTSCATTSDPEGHFYSTGSDPWTTTYTSDATGTAMGSFTVTSGYNVAENDGRVIVVHDSSGTRIACGVLGSVPSTDLGDYPGYSGSRREGYVVLGQDAGAENELNSELTVYYMLTELEETATTGGLHVHSGFSCATADGVGGHFWDSAVADPWTSANGAVWTTTDISGMAGGMFQVRSGYDISTNADHVFVLHNSDGTRAACGVLSASGLATPTYVNEDDSSDDNNTVLYVAVGVGSVIFVVALAVVSYLFCCGRTRK